MLKQKSEYTHTPRCKIKSISTYMCIFRWYIMSLFLFVFVLVFHYHKIKEHYNTHTHMNDCNKIKIYCYWIVKRKKLLLLIKKINHYFYYQIEIKNHVQYAWKINACMMELFIWLILNRRLLAQLARTNTPWKGKWMGRMDAHEERC